MRACVFVVVAALGGGGGGLGSCADRAQFANRLVDSLLGTNVYDSTPGS